ncbi:GPI ethanolamine phosphate transferase 1 [Orchesella cincta]|uniref:GPI ethanolamine phosphate transferase 1 n=1 Tax=Orchesella cincta TaxID=48709 RepID=A0A1D2MR84_ORCCI|nr:GPI ethanolamine phosphate transferase 1 [Orchesella cincta]
MFQLWTLGIVINLFLFYSIFDIYFKSPIVLVDRRHKLDQNVVEPPVKRAVFFVADGLRADTFYQNAERRPYMTQVMKRESSVCGVSDTRVPTESRPGHIALFAGFYEDPSAVFTGWQENTVEFDTIFNQSSASVGLGSEDNVKMFARGSAKRKMFIATFPHEWQDFLSDNLKLLDTWVFDYLSGMIANQTLPRGKEVVVFLSLLAIDTIGHAKKPGSMEYKDALESVDDIVKKSEKMINEYYGDDDTLYIFTSDHGMTNWGSHGDGSLDETETPFVVWGKGIQSNDAEQLRLKQADFTALLSGSLGVGYPSNSVGRFPNRFWKDQHFAYEALKANFYQIFDLMTTKKSSVESNRNFPVIDFKKEDALKEILTSAVNLGKHGEFQQGIRAFNEAIDVAIEGMLYYERYDEQLMIILTVCTTISWIVFVACIVIRIDAAYQKIKGLKLISMQKLLTSLVISVLLIKVVIGWSFARVPYGFFPVYLILILIEVFGGQNGVIDGWREVRTSRSSWINSLLLLLVFCALGVEILVNSFDHRGVLSLGLLLNAVWCVYGKRVSNSQKTLFLIAVAILAVFPLMPVIGKERNHIFMSMGPIASVIIVAIFLYIQGGTSAKKDGWILGGQMLLLLFVSFLCHFPSLLLTRFFAWFSLLQSYLLPVLTSADIVTCRLTSMFLAIAGPFSFISFSYEALFLPSLFLVLIMLLKLEMSDENLDEETWGSFLNLSIEGNERRRIWERVELQKAVRRAWLNLFFVTLSFFGIGNIASINSFDPSSTRCFVSVFNPWIMMLVLIEKILAPFLLVSCFFRRLLWSKIQVERSFLIVLLLCQGMALHTFLKVKNVGSWLEIGTTISHHVIVNATILCIFLLHFIADFLMSYEPWPSSTKIQFSMPMFSNVISKEANKIF